MASVTVIPYSSEEHEWVAVSGAVDAAAAFAALTTFGPDTVTQGGALDQPGFAASIDGLITTMVHSHSSTTGGIAAAKLGTGVEPADQYFLGSTWGGQTTVSVSASVPGVVLNPMVKATGSVKVFGSAGVADPGNGDMSVAFRWSASKLAAKLQWRAAEVDSTAATDTLSDAATAIGGDTTYPFNVPSKCAGVRALGVAMSSDSAAAGNAIGQFRFKGNGLVRHADISAQGHGGEGGATSGFAGIPNIWDDWLQVRTGSPVSLVGGYTGTDVGAEELGFQMAYELPWGA